MIPTGYDEVRGQIIGDIEFRVELFDTEGKRYCEQWFHEDTDDAALKEWAMKRIAELHVELPNSFPVGKTFEFVLRIHQ